MVSSFGVGEGVPCTISYKTIGDSIRVHDIAEQKSIRQKFNDQIKAATNSEIDRLNQQVSELGELVKKEELENVTLKNYIENLHLL